MVNISIKCNETLQNICWEYNIGIFKYQNIGFTELSPWKWVGEKPENIWLIKKFTISYRTQRFITLFTSVCHWFLYLYKWFHSKYHAFISFCL